MTRPVLVLFFVLAVLITSCEEPATTYTSMDRNVTGSISAADLIDQIAGSIGQGAHETGPIVTFDPEWFRCKSNSAKTDFGPGLLVSIRDSVTDPLFIVDSFYSARALLAKTGAGAEWYKKFKLEPGTVLQIVDGPYCFGKAIWWLAITRDKTSQSRDAYLFGFVPESRADTKYLELYEADQ